MWTEERYRREGDGYPSDLRDVEWTRLAPLIPPTLPRGRPRKIDMPAAMNAILYLLRIGCPRRYLPRDSFRRARPSTISFASPAHGVWEAIWAELHMA
jgi:transposase